MGVCKDESELKIVIRCVVVACMDSLTVNELWDKVLNIMGGPHSVQLSIFGYEKAFDYFKSIPDVVQLKNPEDINSLVDLVSSDLSRHMEKLVATNIRRPPSEKKKVAHKELIVPYRVQCAFIRVFMELYPKGMYICNFESTVLSYPIFNSFIDYVELLLWNLDHLFSYKGSEMIILRSTIVNSLKNIKEEDKFTAEDILNIDESILNEKTNDLLLAYGLEYPLFTILEEPIKNNIKILLDEHDWISERKICDLYNDKFGSSFAHYQRWGFSRVSQLFAKLPELCYVNFLDNDVEIISVTKKSKYNCDMNNLDDAIKKPDLLSISLNKKSMRESEKNDGLLKKFLRNDKLLKASLDECFLDQEIQRIELKINQSLNVKVCRVNTTIMPIIICQSLEEPGILQTMLTDMKIFYFMNDSKFMFDPTLIVVKYIYAFYWDDLWWRGFVIDVNPSWVKMANIDNGLIHDIEIDEIRILHEQFSKLPAQSLTFHLHGIDDVDEHVLSQIVDSKCVINVVSINQHDKSVGVKIQFADSKSDEYLNDEWIKNGVAEPV